MGRIIYIGYPTDTNKKTKCDTKYCKTYRYFYSDISLEKCWISYLQNLSFTI